MIVNLNGAKFEVDFLDYETSVLMEEQFAILEEKVAELERDVDEMTQSEMILRGTQPIHDFFDTVLGDGAAQRIFHGKYNYLRALDVLGDFTVQKSKCGDDIEKVNNHYMNILNKGTNAINRSYRRKKHNRKNNTVSK